jgi:hypothetical protein
MVRELHGNGCVGKKQCVLGRRGNQAGWSGRLPLIRFEMQGYGQGDCGRQEHNTS